MARLPAMPMWATTFMCLPCCFFFFHCHVPVSYLYLDSMPPLSPPHYPAWYLFCIPVLLYIIFLIRATFSYGLVCIWSQHHLLDSRGIFITSIFFILLGFPPSVLCLYAIFFSHALSFWRCLLCGCLLDAVVCHASAFFLLSASTASLALACAHACHHFLHAALHCSTWLFLPWHLDTSARLWSGLPASYNKRLTLIWALL